MAKKEETYNEAIEKLRKIVAEIENGDLDVDILSEKVKEATRLIKLCKEKLYKVDEEVKRVRESKEWRRDYMTLLMRDREKYEQGRREGHREGREEGHREGRKEGKLEMVVQLIRNGLLTVKEGAEQLHMTEADITKYL